MPITGQPKRTREIHDLADLLGVGLAQRAAEDREVLREHEDLAPVDGAVARDDAVAVGPPLGQPEVRAAVLHEGVQLDQRARVEQPLERARARGPCRARAGAAPSARRRRAGRARAGARHARASRRWCAGSGSSVHCAAIVPDWPLPHRPKEIRDGRSHARPDAQARRRPRHLRLRGGGRGAHARRARAALGRALARSARQSLLHQARSEGRARADALRAHGRARVPRCSTSRTRASCGSPRSATTTTACSPTRCSRCRASNGPVLGVVGTKPAHVVSAEERAQGDPAARHVRRPRHGEPRGDRGARRARRRPDHVRAHGHAAERHARVHGQGRRRPLRLRRDDRDDAAAGRARHRRDRRGGGERAGGARPARRGPGGVPRAARRRDRARRHARGRHAGDGVPPAADQARRRPRDQVLRLGARGRRSARPCRAA